MKKFALVLSGGGFKGAFQIGALRHLQRNWAIINPGQSKMKFDVVAGVSVGSLNGVLVASDEFAKLEQLWLDIAADVENIYTSDFIDTRNQTDQLKINFNFARIKERFIPNINLRLTLWEGLGMLLSKSKRQKYIDKILLEAERDFTANFRNFRSIADNKPLKARLDALVSLRNIRDCIYRCGFVSLNDGQYYSYRHTDFKTDEDFRKGILASTAMPIVWEPVNTISVQENAGDRAIEQSIDGGIRNVSPLSDVIDEINSDPRNEYTIIIINCNSGEVDDAQFRDANIARIALRSLNDIAITEIFNNDISEFLRINDIIDQVRSVSPATEIYNYSVREGRTKKVLRHFKAIIIQTDPGILGDSLVANAALNARRMAHGEDKAAQALQVIRGGDRQLVIV